MHDNGEGKVEAGLSAGKANRRNNGAEGKGVGIGEEVGNRGV